MARQPAASRSDAWRVRALALTLMARRLASNNPEETVTDAKVDIPRLSFMHKTAVNTLMTGHAGHLAVRGCRYLSVRPTCLVTLCSFLLFLLLRFGIVAEAG